MDTHSANSVTHIKRFYTNCDCLTQTKLSELHCFIKTNSPDVIALTEILPKSSLYETSADSFIIQGYTMFSSNMKSGRGTCILVYIKESLGATDYKVNEPFQEHIWCKLSLTRDDNQLIGCIYRSPHSNADNNQKIFITC